MAAVNPYKIDVDFGALALQDNDFAKILKPNGQLDFSDPQAVQQLTKSLLKRDFGLSLHLPDDRLCPPVPNRLNYILWIQSLLDTSADAYTDRYNAAREVVGVDIGTGASCIYPLLGCSQRPNWRFIGTDIDDKSLEYARQNIQANNLQDRIKLMRTTPDDLLSKLPFGKLQIDFTMCNPPFYASKNEMLASAESKQRPPFTACTGSANEMVTPGGEIAFVSLMIEESLALKHECQWFTSMVGKLSSLSPLIEKLRSHEIGNYAVTEFVQGSKTRRWALGWSFENLRPRMKVSRGVGSLQKAMLPFPSEYTITIAATKPSTVGEWIDGIFQALPLKWMWKAAIATGLGFCETAIWSRAARRQAMREKESRDSTSHEVRDVAFGFKILVTSSTAESLVCVRWIQGQDPVIFESLCGMVKRKVEELNK